MVISRHDRDEREGHGQADQHRAGKPHDATAEQPSRNSGKEAPLTTWLVPAKDDKDMMKVAKKMLENNAQRKIDRIFLIHPSSHR